MNSANSLPRQLPAHRIVVPVTHLQRAVPLELWYAFLVSLPNVILGRSGDEFRGNMYDRVLTVILTGIFGVVAEGDLSTPLTKCGCGL
jgi:hypothetical protein